MDPTPPTPSYDTYDDAQLVAAANAGEPQAFVTLYHRHRDWCLALAYRFTGNAAEALDVMQESFTYLLSRFPGFVLTAPARSYLYPLVKHNALANRRKARRYARFTYDEQEPISPEPPIPPSISEEYAGLYQAICDLHDSRREVVLMSVVDGLSHQEIAAALTILVGTVKSRLHYALQTLREDPRTQAYFTRNPAPPELP